MRTRTRHRLRQAAHQGLRALLLKRNCPRKKRKLRRRMRKKKSLRRKNPLKLKRNLWKLMATMLKR